ncbi:pentatricopeptide repeat-containing protein At2g17670 [Humulus lupulus]|uniref:pentatricopeptide repeat-containing protein At2g17670 n=1 Tax=Humulus lupulus TaxID=3486 RepID=UPI002B403A27|nr:pentatricopeptide repeat-containing protein At2g17670 [Humulus lupulus]XP_062102734.1 pentatricopeptide repeat-containing protein At2g17670 [Humulus lupulus]XP_062102735.1 pentatricopeptide repeat-containing protein At2g17670 [Humulus lupulus]
MGKFPTSFRSAVSSAQLKLSSPLVPAESPSPMPNRPSKSRPSARTTRKPNHSSEPTKSPAPFKSPSLSDAKKIFNTIVTTARSPLDQRFHNSLLQSYASISTVNDSISLLRHMIKTHPSFSPDRSTYHILLAESCKGPDSSLSPVHQALNLMVNDGSNPDKVTTDISVRALCSVGRIEDAIEVVKELSLKHAVPDTFTYNFLVRQLCKFRTLSTVYDFIYDMRSSFSVKPDLVTYTILIDNVCNSKNLREATRLLGVLAEEGFKPDCFLYNTIMKGYCMVSKGSEAIGVYNKMKENGIEPDLVTYNTLIFGLSKSGRAKEARKYLSIMAEMGHFPDVVTYTSLMNGLCREGDALGAFALLEEMEAKGCSPNSCTYNTLLYGFCKSRFLEKGIELYKSMKEGGLQLETAAYAAFVRTLCRHGKIAEAYEVFDYAVESKSLTDVAAFSTLEVTLKGLKKATEQSHVL